MNDFFKAVSVKDDVVLGRKLLRLQTFGVERAFLYLHRHPGEASVLFDHQHESDLFGMLKERLNENVRAFIKQADEHDDDQTVALAEQQAFVVQGVLGLISAWVQDGMKENAVAMTDDLHQLLKHEDQHMAVIQYFNTEKINDHSWLHG